MISEVLHYLRDTIRCVWLTHYWCFILIYCSIISASILQDPCSKHLHGIALMREVLMTVHVLIDIGQNPERGFTSADSDTRVGSNLKRKKKNKRPRHVWCHLLSVSCHPNVKTKARDRTASNFSYSVNLQTTMAGMHRQIAVTEQGTLQWTNPFEHSAFCRERQPAKTGHWSHIAIVSFLMQHCCLPQHRQRMMVFWSFWSVVTSPVRSHGEAQI